MGYLGISRCSPLGTGVEISLNGIWYPIQAPADWRACGVAAAGFPRRQALVISFFQPSRPSLCIVSMFFS